MFRARGPSGCLQEDSKALEGCRTSVLIFEEGSIQWPESKGPFFLLGGLET